MTRSDFPDEHIFELLLNVELYQKYNRMNDKQTNSTTSSNFKTVIHNNRYNYRMPNPINHEPASSNNRT